MVNLALAIGIPVGVIGGGIVLWIVGSLLTGRHSVENWKTTSLRKLSNGAELRRVDGHIVAEVLIPRSEAGDMRAASSKGFRKVARFIFGGNRGRAGGVTSADPLAGSSEKIAMTAPVLIGDSAASASAASGGASERVAMTAPVLMSDAPAAGGADAGSSSDGADAFWLAFVMPSRFKSVEELPRPLDGDVRLRAVPPRYEVFSVTRARFTEELRDEHAATLRAAAAAAGLRVKESVPPRMAGYDPPWTFPLMRRTEVAIEVEAPEGAEPEPAALH